MDVHFVVPDGIDDPERPSGGNVYDRRVCRELPGLGWSVKEHAVPGSWPTPAPDDLAGLGQVVADIADGAVVLLDGLVALAAPEVLVPEARRLRLVVLVHMALGGVEPEESATESRREGAVLDAAVAVVTPSEWTRGLLLDRHDLPPDRFHVARPGADPATLAPGTRDGGELLCVAAVTPHKGHDVLLEALARVPDLPWRCTLVGSLDRDPGWADRLRRLAEDLGVADRVHATGPLAGTQLDKAYADADVLVLASRGETYGMVVTEALARGLPVVATAVGGLPEALGRAPDGEPPGLLVPSEDPEHLSEALCTWLSDARLRRQLRQAAARRRATLSGWSSTADQISRVIAEVA